MNIKRNLYIVTLLLLVLISACEAIQTTEISSSKDTEINDAEVQSVIDEDEIEGQEEDPLLGNDELPTESEILNTNQNALELIEIDSFDKRNIIDIAWSPDGNTLAMVTLRGIDLVNTLTHEETHLKMDKKMYFKYGQLITFSPDGSLLAVSYGKGVIVYDLESQEKLFTLEEFNDVGAYGLAFNHNNTWLATGWGNPWGAPGGLKIWDVSTGTLSHELSGENNNDSIFDIAFNKDGDLMAGISGEGRTYIWDSETLQIVQEFQAIGGYGYAVAFSPDSKVLAAGGAAISDDATACLRLFDLESEEVLFDLQGHEYCIESITFNADGGVLASASSDSIRLWDTQNGEQLANMAVPDIWDPHSVAFNRDGTLLATAGYGDILRLWRMPESSRTMRIPISSAEILQRADAFETIVAANAEAWNANDLDAIQAVLTEDIRFVDETYSDYQEGIDQVLNMASREFKLNPEVQRRVTGHYINLEEAIAVYDYWNLNISSIKFTREDPLIHAMLFEREEDQISSWRLFYGTESMKEIHRISEFEAEQMRSLVSTYAAAWSSMDTTVVSEMYAEDALRRDTLFNEYQDGRSAITSFAETFFSWYPDAHWTPLETFGERAFRNKPQAVGSSYRIEVTDAAGEICEVEAVVLLHIFEGKIVQEDIYYEPASLIECGWAD